MASFTGWRRPAKTKAHHERWVAAQQNRSRPPIVGASVGTYPSSAAGGSMLQAQVPAAAPIQQTMQQTFPQQQGFGFGTPQPQMAQPDLQGFVSSLGLDPATVAQQGLGSSANAQAVYDYATSQGMSPGQIDTGLGFSPGTTSSYLEQTGIAPSAPQQPGFGFSGMGGGQGLLGQYQGGGIPGQPSDLSGFVQRLGLDPAQVSQTGLGSTANAQAVYDYATQRGISPSQIDQQLGFDPGTSQTFVNQMGMTPTGSQGMLSPYGFVGFPGSSAAMNQLNPFFTDPGLYGQGGGLFGSEAQKKTFSL